MRGYQEGGAVRPGHAEGPNPYPEGSARYKLWERKNHIDPPVAAEPAPEVEETGGWLDQLLGRGEDYKGRSERELEEMEEATGGYIDGYANGGLAQFSRPPMGGVPRQIAGTMKPRMGGVPPRIDPRAMPPQMPGGGATTGQSSLPAHLRNIAGRAGPLQATTGGPGRPPPRMVPPSVRNIPWRGAPPPRAIPGPVRPTPGVDPRGGPGIPPSDGMGPAGGPRVPPNLRGYMNRARMMNRPRRGIPGPAGAGGAPNRVGQSDQQGGLARALQRGTGRPPMSRRQGFYR